VSAYPKDFFSSETSVDVEQGLCFVLMPFEDKFNPIWQIIRETAEGDPFNLQCIRADQIARPGYIMEDVLQYIARAGFIIADLTDRNPNVFYELGIAHSIKSSSTVLLLSQSIDFVPFDLRPLRCLIYNPDLSNLRKQLAEAFTDADLGQYRICLREGERKKFPSRISGRDLCLYEVECQMDYIGSDGVKFNLLLFRFVSGQEPQKTYEDSKYLGRERDYINLPGLDWKLSYGGRQNNEATIYLQRIRKI
jgi:hypothetical protein